VVLVYPRPLKQQRQATVRLSPAGRQQAWSAPEAGGSFCNEKYPTPAFARATVSSAAEGNTPRQPLKAPASALPVIALVSSSSSEYCCSSERISG
jgi:hypothetical protein